ncbi:MAG: 4Fe-4S binding protein [Candidatus Thiodiazotropha sp. (ex Ctena orbiculata)]|nr:4Fe-4S binding protein [Candidatus Thiodiazotropha taylori]
MPFLKDLFNRIREEEKLPVVDPDRCVHSLIEIASCSACVEVCPTKAWTLDDEALLFDASVCDGCGLCLPICPESALSVQYEILCGDLDLGKIVLSACEETGMKDTQGVLPCIHMISLNDILNLYNQGYLQWVIATGNCSECQRGCTTTLCERIQQVNHALDEEGLPLIDYHATDFTSWQRIQSLVDDTPPTASLSRRAFLRGVLENSVNNPTGHFKQKQPATTAIPPGKLMPNQNRTTIWPYVPQINSNLCNGCDACVNTCPHNAIGLLTDNDNLLYEIRPEACTECGICRDVCEKQAITIMKWTKQPQRTLALNAFTCSSCGNPAHSPSDDHQSLCRICEQVNHQRNLYQVMD